MSTDAIVILRDEHKQIRRAFRDYERTNDTQTAARSEMAQRIIHLLTVHTYLEDQVMYPRVRELVPTLDRAVLRSYEEHHVADLLLSEIADLESYEERFDAKMSVLIANVQHHMDDEEGDWFPQVRAALGRSVLQDIGKELVLAREGAPTGPPPGNPVAKALKSLFE